MRRLPYGATVVEVGVFVGALSRYLLHRRPDISMILVDNWAPEEMQPAAYRATNDRHAHTPADLCVEYRLKAKRNVDEFRSRATVLCMPSVMAATIVPNDSVDMVFIDGDHSFDGVWADLMAWEPKVKPGGFIGGHDYNNKVPGVDYSGVKRAVDRFAAGRILELDGDYTWFVGIA